MGEAGRDKRWAGWRVGGVTFSKLPFRFVLRSFTDKINNIYSEKKHESGFKMLIVPRAFLPYLVLHFGGV